jgi:hypothetical protein
MSAMAVLQTKWKPWETSLKTLLGITRKGRFRIANDSVDGDYKEDICIVLIHSDSLSTFNSQGMVVVLFQAILEVDIPFW